MTLWNPLNSFVHKNLFFLDAGLNSGSDGNYSKSILTVTYSMSLIFNVFLGPIVEELYFRGYLLPRMKGKFAILFHSFLFAAVHVFTPWMIIARTFQLLPILFWDNKEEYLCWNDCPHSV